MSPAASHCVLILGCGDIGRRIGRQHLGPGVEVIGAVRSAASAAAVAAAGLVPLRLDLDQPLPPLPCADTVYWCAPPPAEGETDRRLRAVLTVLRPPAQGLLYISTSAVYGDCQGRWISEAEPLKPGSGRGRRRLDAELALRAWSARTGARTVVLRVPGIYGPGRLPVERLRRGDPVLREQDSPYTNRVHADDLAAACMLALRQGEVGAAYNISDGRPTTMSDYLLRCARLLGLPEPPRIALAEAAATFSPMLMSFLEESKRLDASRLRALGWQPRHPDLDEGLPACV
ncbi:MAG: SDR family oxidoreductase [Stagnimonas sp.]|nr:SDR family oxidoreductase [Stagnimonas sp.]